MREPWQGICPWGSVPIGHAALAIGLGLNDVAFKQRFQLLRVPHQIRIPRIHDGGVDSQVAFVLDDPSHHLIDLILACRVVATAAQMAVDGGRPRRGVGHVDQDGKLLGQLRRVCTCGHIEAVIKSPSLEVCQPCRPVEATCRRI